ncbi:MAG: acetyl-CoA carboxylase carboxyltransferase subunit beta [Endozoicomonadaceae bacterium]|nr:acetyl-CoA carboxylase carboxyltransferase subunit beta [Endozoicomonadaceae bacterium]MBE8233069.1 acetyl-CoA carboxylase carboxyltransferase subunit beta [Endozoicomonadaceae bacterium]
MDNTIMTNWLNRLIPSLSSKLEGDVSSHIPKGIWNKCKQCDAILYQPELDRNMHVCQKCDYHFRLSARQRLSLFLNQNTVEELFQTVKPLDRLKFKDTKKYKDRLLSAQKTTGEIEAILCMKGALDDVQVVALASDFNFMAGSMSSAVGEKFVRAVDHALGLKLPLICFAVSGGARMQESLFSLMQMARTSAAVEKMKQQGIPFISVLTDPCYGGVTASYAMLGDINIAEPKASIGFAGPRVIEQTVREKLPEGFQSSEFLMEHGAIDMVIHRHHLKATITRLLRRMLAYQHSKVGLLAHHKDF